MFNFRDFIIFLAGFEFFHTFAHIMFAFVMTFPMDFKFIVLTETMNNFAIFGNAIVTVLLIVWARKMSRRA